MILTRLARRAAAVVVVVVLAVMAGALPAFAVASPVIRGVVTDMDGNPVAGSVVAKRTTNGTVTKTVPIQPDGSYEVTDLDALRWSITVLPTNTAVYRTTQHLTGDLYFNEVQLKNGQVTVIDVTVFKKGTSVQATFGCTGCGTWSGWAELQRFDAAGLWVPVAPDAWSTTHALGSTSAATASLTITQTDAGDRFRLRAIAGAGSGFDFVYSPEFEVIEGQANVISGVIPLKRADVITRVADGRLYRHTSVSTTALPPGVQIGSGYQVYNRIIDAGDVDRDGIRDLVTTKTSGAMYLLAGKPDGTFQKAVAISTGWKSYNIVIGPGDVTGDGLPDLVARLSTGALYVAAGTGDGRFAKPRLIGSAAIWKGFSGIVAAGDIDGDELGDLIARDSAGRAWRFQSYGGMTFNYRIMIATTWKTVNGMVGLGWFDGQDGLDLMLTMTNGDVYMANLDANGDVATFKRITTKWVTRLLI